MSFDPVILNWLIMPTIVCWGNSGRVSAYHSEKSILNPPLVVYLHAETDFMYQKLVFTSKEFIIISKIHRFKTQLVNHVHCGSGSNESLLQRHIMSCKEYGNNV